MSCDLAGVEVASENQKMGPPRLQGDTQEHNIQSEQLELKTRCQNYVASSPTKTQA